MDRSYWSFYAILNILRDFGYVSQDSKCTRERKKNSPFSFFVNFVELL